jgi:hypothetical protein
MNATTCIQMLRPTEQASGEAAFVPGRNAAMAPRPPQRRRPLPVLQQKASPDPALLSHYPPCDL